MEIHKTSVDKNKFRQIKIKFFQRALLVFNRIVFINLFLPRD